MRHFMSFQSLDPKHPAHFPASSCDPSIHPSHSTDRPLSLSRLLRLSHVVGRNNIEPRLRRAPRLFSTHARTFTHSEQASTTRFAVGCVLAVLFSLASPTPLKRLARKFYWGALTRRNSRCRRALHISRLMVAACDSDRCGYLSRGSRDWFAVGIWKNWMQGS